MGNENNVFSMAGASFLAALSGCAYMSGGTGGVYPGVYREGVYRVVYRVYTGRKGKKETGKRCKRSKSGSTRKSGAVGVKE